MTLFPREKSPSGFTLIEVLLAVGLFTIITVSASSLFWGATKTWWVVRYEARCMKTARMVFTQLEEDLRNVVDSIGQQQQGGSTFLPFLYAADARSRTADVNKNELVFHVARPGNQLMQVTYYIANAQNRDDYQTRFSRQDKNIVTSAPSAETVIASRFDKITVRFIDLQSGSLVYLDNWKDSSGAPKTNLPKAIEVTITFKEMRGVGPKWTKTIAIPRELGV